MGIVSISDYIISNIGKCPRKSYSSNVKKEFLKASIYYKKEKEENRICDVHWNSTENASITNRNEEIFESIKGIILKDMCELVEMLEEVGRLDKNSVLGKSTFNDETALEGFCRILLILATYQKSARMLFEKVGNHNYYFIGELGNTLVDNTNEHVKMTAYTTQCSNYEDALAYVNKRHKTSVGEKKLLGGALLKGSFDFQLSVGDYIKIYIDYAKS